MHSLRAAIQWTTKAPPLINRHLVFVTLCGVFTVTITIDTKTAKVETEHLMLARPNARLINRKSIGAAVEGVLWLADAQPLSPLVKEAHAHFPPSPERYEYDS